MSSATILLLWSQALARLTSTFGVAHSHCSQGQSPLRKGILRTLSSDLKSRSSAKTVWPSGLRRWLKAPFRKGVGSNPTAVIRYLCSHASVLYRKLDILVLRFISKIGHSCARVYRFIGSSYFERSLVATFCIGREDLYRKLDIPVLACIGSSVPHVLSDRWSQRSRTLHKDPRNFADSVRNVLEVLTAETPRDIRRSLVARPSQFRR